LYGRLDGTTFATFRRNDVARYLEAAVDRGLLVRGEETGGWALTEKGAQLAASLGLDTT